LRSAMILLHFVGDWEKSHGWDERENWRVCLLARN
jgi:hypothetical protein